MFNDIKIKEKIGDKYYFEEDRKNKGYFTKDMVYRATTAIENNPMIIRKKLIDEYEERATHEKSAREQDFIKQSSDFKKNNKLRDSLKINNKKCIYCGQEYVQKYVQEKPLGGEHVIARGLGGIEILDCVCSSCNTYFATELDLPLLRDSADGILRYDKDVKSREARFQKSKFITLETPEGPAWIDGTTNTLKLKSGQPFTGQYDSNGIWYDFDLIGTFDIVMLRARAKNIFNFVEKYIGYDEIIKKEWDNVRNYVRYDNPRIYVSVSMDKNFWEEELCQPCSIEKGVSVRVKNYGSNVIGVISIYNFLVSEYTLVENYNIPGLNKIVGIFPVKSEPLIIKY